MAAGLWEAYEEREGEKSGMSEINKVFTVVFLGCALWAILSPKPINFGRTGGGPLPEELQTPARLVLALIFLAAIWHMFSK